MAAATWLPYLAMAVLWCVCLWWHGKENKELSNSLLSEPLRRRVVRLAWGRTFQLLLTLLVCMGLTAGLHWKLSSLPPPSSPPALPDIPPAVTAAPVAIPPEETARPLAPPANIADMFAPDAAAPSGQQAALNELKSRYESLFVNYLYLSRCNQAQPSDFYALHAGLARELASLNGPGRLTHDILTAARGSYVEVYAPVPCTGAEAESPAFRTYIDQLDRQQEGWIPSAQ